MSPGDTRPCCYYFACMKIISKNRFWLKTMLGVSSLAMNRSTRSGSFRHPLIASLWYFLLILGVASTHTQNAEEVNDMTRFGQIQSASFVFVSDNIFFRSPLTQASLNEFGCRFSTSNEMEIRQLNQIFSRFEFHRNVDSVAHFQLRGALYLRLTDGGRVTLLLGNANDDVVIVNKENSLKGNSSSQAIVVDNGFRLEIKKWGVVRSNLEYSDHEQYSMCLKEFFNDSTLRFD